MNDQSKPAAPMQAAFHEYLEGYELRGEGGDYSPTEGERGMLEDFGWGLIQTLGDAGLLIPVDRHDVRVTELLASNNREVERRRAAERAAAVATDLQNAMPGPAIIRDICVDDLIVYESGFNAFARHVHRLNHRWWHDRDGKPLERNKGELLCLIHSEISEAMEGERKSLQDDKLPHRPMAEVELADAIIRICDYAAGFGYDLDGAVTQKLAFNQTRQDHQHDAREAAHGKKW